MECERKNNHREDKTVLERSFSVKVQVEALEALLGPEDVDVDLRRILKEARDERERHIFETSGSNDTSFLVRVGLDGTNTKELHGDEIRRPLQEMDGGKQAWDSLRNR